MRKEKFEKVDFELNTVEDMWSGELIEGLN